MLNVAVLDDYQNVTKKFGNWSELEGKINLKIFNKYRFLDKNVFIIKKKQQLNFKNMFKNLI